MKGLIDNNRIDKNASIQVISSSIALDNMLIESFPTNHDTPQPCCYKVTTGDDRTAMVATDLGVMTDTLRKGFLGVDALVLESNHDINMLKNGSYPYYLQQRILSNQGHLSNKSCANELPDIIKNGTMRIMLGHLSQENNRPEIALKESLDYLTNQGFKRDYDYTLDVAPVETNGKVILF
jgi:phosphoribosyl 1,2-cyclic phosphodiesterase